MDGRITFDEYLKSKRKMFSTCNDLEGYALVLKTGLIG